MRFALITAALLITTPALGQESDSSYLTTFLEDSLSEAGRDVTITGFSGALSSQATIETLTIADDAGIWLTINDVTLDWSRSALLSGELTVSELSAAEIIVSRLPDMPESDLPTPEAAGFTLPELPVSIDIERIAAERIVLDPSVLGQPVEGSLESALTLAEGNGTATLDLTRTGEGPLGQIALDASYSNASRQLQITLDAAEDAGGIVVTLLGVPRAPAAEFQVNGQGALEDFQAEVRLATDGEERLTGQIALLQDDAAAYRLLADLSGNLAPLLAPDYVDFFGTAVALKLDAGRSDTGRVTLNEFVLSTRSLMLQGRGVLAADGLPEEFDLSGTLASPDGAPILLPFGDTETRVGKADFRLRAKDSGDVGWRGEIRVAGLDRADLKAELLALEGSGRIGRTPAGNSFGGTLKFVSEGLLPADAGLAAALGRAVQGGLRFHFLEGSDAVSLSDLRLTGEDVAVKGSLDIEGLKTGFLTSGSLELTATDLSRFALLAGRPLAGSGSIRLNGSASRLSGAVDGTAEISATGLKVGIDQVDTLLAGQSTATLSVLRDETGTTLRSVELAADGLTAQASGKLASAGSELEGEIALSSLSQLDAAYSGSTRLAVTFRGTPERGTILLTGSGRGLRIGNDRADRLLAGNSSLAAELQLEDGVVLVESAKLSNPQLSLGVSGALEGGVRALDITARLADLGLLVPDLRGPLVLEGPATQDASGYSLDLAARGPGQVDGRIKGRIASNFSSADLTLAGTGSAGLANLFIAPRALAGAARFDLRLAGPIAPSSLSGRVTLSDGRLTDPNLGLALEGIEGMAQLDGGRAEVSATSRLSTGGLIRVDGPVNLAPPFDAELAMIVDNVRLVDPELYETRVGGVLDIRGPLAGGATISGTLALSEAELRVPSSGFATAAALLEIRHVNEPRDVRDTRVRAGLIDTTGSRNGGGDVGRSFRLDLTLSAPSQVFVRGRGIDAELGGEIRLGGTTAAIVPAGEFRLIRGRLDILGKRLVLSEASLDLEGSFTPNIRVSAQTESDGIVSSVTIEGPADDPVVSFTSAPDLPQEEVLARLLFGRDLTSLSALQAAQLANAIAVLAGRDGIGLVNRLRKGFGLDNLDLTTSEDGTAALTAGKYISDNVYTEIEVEQGGKSRISLNLDLRDGVTVKGRVGEDGSTGIGIFIERDY